MDGTFFDGLHELHHRAKFGEDCTTRTGCRCEKMVFVCFLPAECREAETAGIKFTIKFTHGPKIRFFAPQGRLVAPIQVKLCRTDVHLCPLGCAKLRLNRQRGWECGPKNIKNFHFLVKRRPAGATPLTHF